MDKTSKQKAIECAEKYKLHLQQEKELFDKYQKVSRCWMDKIEEGIEDSTLGNEMDLALAAWKEEKNNVNILARVAMDYIFDAGIL